MSKLIINCETNEETTRELNKAEKDQQKTDEAKVLAVQAQAETRTTARKALLTKLGITAEEAQLLLS
jgi:co-chaperonin GroES (HSP10)